MWPDPTTLTPAPFTVCSRAVSLYVPTPAYPFTCDPLLRHGAALPVDPRSRAASERRLLRRQILKLEGEIGSPLFERLPAGLRLTAAGEVFARHVLVVLQDAARASSELDALQGLRTGHVEIATVSGVTVDLLR